MPWGLLPYEHVLVANVNTGQRGETYTIPGQAGSGDIQLNGRDGPPRPRRGPGHHSGVRPDDARKRPRPTSPGSPILDGRNKITDQWEGERKGSWRRGAA